MATKTARMEFRLLQEHKDLLEKAAALSGQNLTPFAVSVLIEASREILEDHSRTQLSLKDQELFLKIIDADEEPAPSLKTAASRFKSKNGR